MSDYDTNWKSLDGGKNSTGGCCCSRRSRCGRCFKSNLLLILLLCSIAIGIGLGALLKAYGPEFSERDLVYFQFPGDLLMRMLKCLIIPLIVSSLVAGLGGLETGTSGKMGLYAVVYYFATTILAVMLGILLVMTIKPGEKLSEDVDTTGEASYDPLTQKEDGMNILGLVVFSIALGVVTSKLGHEGRPLYEFARSLAEGTMLLVNAVIWYSPIGILFLVAAEIIRMEDPIAELQALGLYIATVVCGLIIHGFIILPLIYLIFVRTNPYKYLLGALQALLTALGTASRCLEENNNIDPRVTRFVLPVGATINMDGTALYEAVAALFIAQSLGMELDAATVVTVSLTATLASIGAASVPQAGLVTMIMVLTAIGIDPDEVTKILAVDWLL
ncbi:hypothetical protein LSH36_446g02028 [Paralvinella palmiformis]|uniref:Amino acid transporter n=1 Tax=Paralvinella palmiformis TaxID=53620 RepID=A0AAD9MXZ3_9ANNE|nr:hypothetical protein LSH36_446g02028 [Paralvinella palmiformis]